MKLARLLLIPILGLTLYGQVADLSNTTIGGKPIIVGPAANTNNLVPQWDGANSKTLRDGLAAASTNTISTLVQRDGSGDFASNVLTLNGLLLTNAARFKFNDTVTSYPALIGQGAATSVNHFMFPTAVNGRNYSFVAQMSSGATVAGDKVAIYAAAESGASTSNVWAGNFLGQHNAGDADINLQAVEIDVNENDADRTADVGNLRSALSLTSGGSKHPGAALYINSTAAGNSWREGIHMEGVSTYGIDLQVLAGALPIKLRLTSADAAGPEIKLQKARGTPGAETAALSGDKLGAIRASGFGTSFQDGGWIEAVAAENWGAAATGMGWNVITIAPTTTSLTATISVPADGGIKLYPGGLAKPACNAAHRGTFWYTLAAAGTKDDVQVCAKAADNSYAWRVIY